MAVYTKPSTLAAAALPATTTEPKEFTEDWMITLDRENRLPWMPAGRPMRIMASSCSR